MNCLTLDRRSQVIAALVEGVPINATCRMTGVAKHTVLKLLNDLGCAAASYHDAHVRNLRVRRVQCDEIKMSRQSNCTTTHLAVGLALFATPANLAAEASLPVD